MKIIILCGEQPIKSVEIDTVKCLSRGLFIIEVTVSKKQNLKSFVLLNEVLISVSSK